MCKRMWVLMFALLPFVAYGQGSKRTYDSYDGLVMTGYQGWFGAPGDGAGRGWYHYTGKDGFRPGSCSVDYWPEVSEYTKLYETEFMFSDGTPAHTFSSYDFSTTDLHFRWMKEYGIDGAFMQRFIGEIKRPKSKAHLDHVLQSAMTCAENYNRAISVMYDLSGMRPGDEEVLLDDIDNLEKEYGMKERKNVSYLYHNGKPLVAVWGVGFNDNRAYGFKEAGIIIDGLRKRGYSIMLGVPTHWREFGSDTENNPELHALIKKCDVVMPWFVGRYNENTYAPFIELIKKDLIWCRENNLHYVPLAFPGFSWKNMKGPNSSQIPRNKGSFLWKQMSEAIQAGAGSLYIAMFDEIDEGTAIFKCATEVPVGQPGSTFVPLEPGLRPDHYLWLTGEAGKMLRKEISLTTKLPVRPGH